MTLSTEKCQFLYKKKVGRTLLYEVSPYGSLFVVIKLEPPKMRKLFWGKVGASVKAEDFTVR